MSSFVVLLVLSVYMSDCIAKCGGVSPSFGDSFFKKPLEIRYYATFYLICKCGFEKKRLSLTVYQGNEQPFYLQSRYQIAL